MLYFNKIKLITVIYIFDKANYQIFIYYINLINYL